MSYSTLALRDILSEEHRLCWQYFVDTLNLWCQQIISKDDIEKGHFSIVKCLQLAKELYR